MNNNIKINVLLYIIISILLFCLSFKYPANPNRYISLEEKKISRVKELQFVEKVNINSDNIDDLIQLKGIGKNKAKKIIEYRKQHGDFKNKRDIKKVPGVNQALYDKIKNLIVV